MKAQDMMALRSFVFLDKSFKRLFPGLALFLLCCFPFPALCLDSEKTDDGGLSVHLEEKWRTVFAEQKVVYNFHISSEKPVSGRLYWSLRYEHRTVRRGETIFEAGPEQPSENEIRFETPPVKEGVILPLLLNVELRDKENRPVNFWEDTLYIYPRDPFVYKRNWLKSLEIGLFDPEKQTGKFFEQLGVPFSHMHNIGALADFKGSLLVIGSGMDLSYYGTLWETVLELAGGGTSVLVLAPGKGIIPIAGEERIENLLQLADFRLSNEKMISRLNKKLDSRGWAVDGNIVASSARLLPIRETVNAEWFSGDSGWPWVEIEFHGNEKMARVIVCGFDITGKMEAGPTPRYLLDILFEYLTLGGEPAG